MKCKTCKHEYIGKTERILSIRVDEHQNDKKDKNSACKQHLRINHAHEYGYSEVEVLDSADNDRKLRIKELLHILSRSPELNKQHGSQSKYKIKKLIIRAYPQLTPE